ncbi:MAG: M28 family metallopeptidase [Kiritimatiellia bacterium]
MRGLILSLLALCAACAARGGAISFTAADARLAHDTAAGLVRDCTPRHAGTAGAIRAAVWLSAHADVAATLDRFRDNIYDEVCDFANVCLEIPGENPSGPWVVLLSHFDTTPQAAKGFEGANDGASTSGLLVALARAVRRAGTPRDNLMFVWTDGEECRIAYRPRDGFHGSKRLLRRIREMRRPVKAVICLDMLGDRDLNIEIPWNSTPALRRLTLEAAGKAGVADKVSLRDSITIKDDHSAFFDAGYPAIDIIDFDFGSARGKNDYWHTPQDTMDNISVESLHASGRLVAELLNLLSTRREGRLDSAAP